MSRCPDFNTFLQLKVKNKKMLTNLIGGFMVSQFTYVGDWIASRRYSLKIPSYNWDNFTFHSSTIAHRKNSFGVRWCFIDIFYELFPISLENVLRSESSFVCTVFLPLSLYILLRLPRKMVSANIRKFWPLSGNLLFNRLPRGTCAVRHVTIRLRHDIIVFVVIGSGGAIWKAKQASSARMCVRWWKLSGFYINLVHLIGENMTWRGVTTVVEAVGGV